MTGEGIPPAGPLNGQPGRVGECLPAAETQPDVPASGTETEEADGQDPGPARYGDRMLTGPLVPESGHGEPADKRRTGRTVLAEWALWGKGPRDLEYGVLRCSKGVFRPGDFYEIIARYTPGAKETLPQYTVCWIPGENGHEGYLAVAIHESADPDPRRSGGRVQAAEGREIEYIRLFCVRYSEMGRHQASYTELVESVMTRQLTDGSTGPITVELPEVEPAPFPGRVQALAENAATLLLTTRPVCVLGAERTTAEERLLFIDQVMSLLPYGLRSTMSASTWASATARNLKLRLFFAGAERDDGGATAHMTWGSPGQLDLSAPGSTHVRHYVNWLARGGAGALAELAGQTDPVRFDADDIRKAVAELPSDRPVRDVLEELADGLHRRQLPVIQAAVRRLRRRRTRLPSAEEVRRYRQDIKRLGLLTAHPEVQRRTEASVFRVLLDLAFGPKLSYAAYCEIEDCAGGPPSRVLGREMMLRLQFSSYLSWLLTVKSATELTDRELMDSLHRQGIEAAAPITEFRERTGAVRLAHRRVCYDLAVRYLRAYAEDPRAELRKRGYLTGTLEQVFPHDRLAQRSRLKETLAFAYGGMLSEEQSAELLLEPDVRRTAAFDEAVAELTMRPGTGKRHGLRALPAYLKAFPERVRSVELTFRGLVVVLALLLIAGVVIGITIAHLLRPFHV